jgi:hypothetical protein
MKTTNTRRILTIALAGLFMASFAGSAMAETQWDRDHAHHHVVKHHPKRIHHEVKTMHHEDHK